MKVKDFKNYMEYAEKANKEELELLSCAGYYLLDMTDQQISKLANLLVAKKGFVPVDGRLTKMQVVIFGAFELTL